MFITSIYCCHVAASSVPAVTKFAKTAAIPATIPVPTNAGIIGTKILEMSFNTDLILDGFVSIFVPLSFLVPVRLHGLFQMLMNLL